MKYYLINPEVPCSWGKNIQVDRSTHPPVVNKLHIEFEGWLGDDLITTFPIYAVSEKLKSDIETNNLSGIHFNELEVSFSETFKEVYGENRNVPLFLWAKIDGGIGEDFHLQNGYNLIVSEKALNVLKNNNLNNAEILEPVV